MKKNTLHLIIMSILWVLFSCSAFAGDRAAMIDRAHNIIATAFDSPELEVKNVALAMLTYDNDDTLFMKLQEYFIRHYTLADQSVYTCLVSLYAIDSDKTVSLLRENNDQVLQSLNLYRMFSIIGFEKVVLFDNLFYFIEINTETRDDYSLFKALVFARYYLETKDERYYRFLKFSAPHDLNPGEYLFLYEYYKKHKLPLKKLIVMIKSKARVLGFDEKVTGGSRYGVSATFTLDELLYQALLYRMKLTKDVYTKTFTLRYPSVITLDSPPYSRYSVAVEKVERDYKDYGVSGYLMLCDALAHFYAGKATDVEYRFVSEYFHDYKGRTREIMFSAIAHAPKSKYRTAVLLDLLTTGDPELIVWGLAALKQDGIKKLPATVTALLQSQGDAKIKVLVLELMAQSGNKAYYDTITSFMHDADPVVSVTAAGLWLQLVKG